MRIEWYQDDNLIWFQTGNWASWEIPRGHPLGTFIIEDYPNMSPPKDTRDGTWIIQIGDAND